MVTGGLSEDRKGVEKGYPVQKITSPMSFSAWLFKKEMVLVWGLRVVIPGMSLDVGTDVLLMLVL